MTKRTIILSGVMAAVLFAPIAEARGGRGSRSAVIRCTESPCDDDSRDDDDDTTSTASVATTVAESTTTAETMPPIGGGGGSEDVPTESTTDVSTTDVSTSVTDPVPSSDGTVPSESVVSNATTAASTPTASSSSTPTAAVTTSSSSPVVTDPAPPSSSSTPTDPAPSSSVVPPDATSSTTAAPPVDPTTTPPPPPDTTPPPPPPPPPPATFSMSTATPHVGEDVTFDGSAFACDPVASCSYTWTWFFRSADGTTTFTGGQMGLGTTVTYAFDAFAASKPFVIVVLRVSEGRIGPRTVVSSTFRVLPAA